MFNVFRNEDGEHLHFHWLEAHINADNAASKAVALKCRYSFEGVRKGFIYENGMWTDNEIYYINNEAWTELLW